LRVGAIGQNCERCSETAREASQIGNPVSHDEPPDPYLGLNLKHPIVVGASPLAFSIDMVRRIEDAGAAAIVLHSLFEEQAAQGNGPRDDAYNADPEAEARGFPLNAEQYVEHLQHIKQVTDFPVIASLNGTREGNWVRYAQYLEQAGADALELNLYFLPTSDDESSSVVEQRAFQIVRLVRQFVSIPVAVKLSPFFTSLPHFAHRMEEAGAMGLVLFNRFFQPDIDIEKLQAQPRLGLSSPDELLLRLRWIAALHGRLRLGLAVTGGVHDVSGVVKSLMAGADCVQVVSAVMKRGPNTSASWYTAWRTGWTPTSSAASKRCAAA
jgi:dihydroorotate dehydrogenase (fumarate)